MGTLISWNPLGHSRPVTGLLFTVLPRLDEDLQYAYHFYRVLYVVEYYINLTLITEILGH